MGNLGQGFAQVLLVVIINCGDDRDFDLLRHVGGVKPAAEPHFQHQIIRRFPREGEEGRCCGYLEKGNRPVAIGRLTFFQQG